MVRIDGVIDMFGVIRFAVAMIDHEPFIVAFVCPQFQAKVALPGFLCKRILVLVCKVPRQRRGDELFCVRPVDLKGVCPFCEFIVFNTIVVPPGRCCIGRFALACVQQIGGSSGVDDSGALNLVQRNGVIVIFGLLALMPAGQFVSAG